MKRRQNDGRYPDEYAGYSDQGYDESYDDGSGFQDDPFSETSAAANHRVKAQQAQDKPQEEKGAHRGHRGRGAGAARR